jgi:DNA mismatch repair protein MutS2
MRAIAAPSGPARPFGVGDAVHVRSMGRDGKIVGVGNREGRVFVEAAGVRLEVALGDLEEPRDAPGPKRAAVREKPNAEDARYELDLRGLRAEEARDALDKFIDRAVVAGIPSVRVIHGIGTGVIRSEVAAMLKDDPRVGASRLGENGGFTIVEIG